MVEPDDDSADIDFGADGTFEEGTKGEVESDDPQAAVSDWKVVALGRRPQDYLVRDLLLGSLFRSRLPTRFHKMSKRPPAWIRKATEPLEQSQQAQAQQLLVLLFLHLEHLAGLVNSAQKEDKEFGDKNGFSYVKLLKQLWRCWPFGMKVEWLGSDKRTPRDICGLSWLCPWCHARKALDLFRRILQGPLAKTDEKNLCLVQCSLSVLAEEVRRRGGPSSFLACYRQVRQRLARSFKKQATNAGVRGGVTTLQVGPSWSGGNRSSILPGAGKDATRSLEFRLGLLGVAPVSAMEGLPDGPDKRFVDVDMTVGKGPWQSRGFGRFWPIPDRRETEQNVRLLLVGSSANYPMNVDVAPGATSNGIAGVLGWQPLFLLDAVDWLGFAKMIRKQRLFDPFGDWRGTLDQRAVSKLPKGRRKRLDQAAIRNRAMANREAARKRRQAQLKIARSLWPQVMEAARGERGRPRHRLLLAELLKAQGVEVSQRDLRYLMAQLG